MIISILSNICIIVLITFFLFVFSVKFIEFAIAPGKIDITRITNTILLLHIVIY
jgi:hypothetical protein